MPDSSLIVLGMGSLVLGYIGYHMWYSNETSNDANDPDPVSGVQSTNTANVVPGRHPKPPLRMGVHKLRKHKGDNAYALASSAFFEP